MIFTVSNFDVLQGVIEAVYLERTKGWEIAHCTRLNPNSMQMTIHKWCFARVRWDLLKGLKNVSNQTWSSKETAAYVGLTLYKATKSISTPRLPCHANDCCYSQLHPGLPPASPINMNMLGRGRHREKNVSRLRWRHLSPHRSNGNFMYNLPSHWLLLQTTRRRLTLPWVQCTSKIYLR